MTELLACMNAGDHPRILALLSTEKVRLTLSIPADWKATLRATPTPVMWESQWFALCDVTDVRVLEEGRLSAFVAYSPGCRERRATVGGMPIMAIFKLEDGQWRLDATMAADAFQSDPTPPS